MNVDEYTQEMYDTLLDFGRYPLAGFYKIRLHKGGSFHPAELVYVPKLDPLTGEVLDRGEDLVAFIDGERAPIERVWVFGKKIEIGEFKWMRAITAIRQKG